MELQAVTNSISAGMEFERSRIESATFKIAVANVDFASKAELRDFLANSQESAVVRAEMNEIGDSDVTVVHSPGSPKADAGGYVYRLNVDPTHEMATLVSATRAYEANIRAYNVHNDITRSALSIGRDR